MLRRALHFLSFIVRFLSAQLRSIEPTGVKDDWFTAFARVRLAISENET